MINNAYWDEMMAKSKRAAEELSGTLGMMEKTLEEAINSVPEADRPKTEEISSLCKQAVAAARRGDADAIENLLKRYQNGR